MSISLKLVIKLTDVDADIGIVASKPEFLANVTAYMVVTFCICLMFNYDLQQKKDSIY